MDIHSRLTDVFRSVFSDEKIELEDTMTANDINGWDSVAHITLIFAIEEEFGIQFSTAELSNLTNVGQLRCAVVKRVCE